MLVVLPLPLSHCSCAAWTVPSPHHCGVPVTLWQLVLHREQLVVDGYGHTVLVVLLLPLSHCSGDSTAPLPQLACRQSFPLQPLVQVVVTPPLQTPPAQV